MPGQCCPLALFGPDRPGRRCPLLRAKRTSQLRAGTSEFDPEPTLMQWQTRRPSAGHRLREGSAGVAALHLGQHEGDELRYIGKIGSGFTRKSSIENRRKLDAITTAKSPLTKPVRTLKLRGVEPKYVADVEYRDGAAEG